MNLEKNYPSNRRNGATFGGMTRSLGLFLGLELLPLSQTSGVGAGEQLVEAVAHDLDQL
jgi:hypothetical protein